MASAPPFKSRVTFSPSDFCINSLSIVMLRCSRSAGLSVTCTVSRPLFWVRLGRRSDGNLKPATAMLPIISVANSMPIVAKKPMSRMLSDILLFFTLRIVPEPFRQRLI